MSTTPTPTPLGVKQPVMSSSSTAAWPVTGAALEAALKKRPRLTAATVVEYLDWLTANIGALPAQHTAQHMQAAELAIRTLATEAQNKATQHTLVESGVIDPPPAAS
ncbi:MAG TPA: hypothetical protein VIJ79_04435 [Acidobacteriaceae bacterium]